MTGWRTQNTVVYLIMNSPCTLHWVPTGGEAMKRAQFVFIAAVLYLFGLSVARASEMQCNGNLVSAGDTEQQVLAICGEPTARRENRWIYRREGDLPKILTFGDGVVMLIEDGDDPGFGQSSPLGDHL
jgi:hypothetical protein